MVTNTKYTTMLQEFHSFHGKAAHTILPFLAKATPTQKFNLPSARTYHRSLSYTTDLGINPLISAASPLLLLIHTLQETPSYQALEQLEQHLCHEIRAFEASAQYRAYPNEPILLARYILCATLDDIILHTPWGKSPTEENPNDWTDYSLLTTFHSADLTTERFFLILDRLLGNPAQYIDLLELMYLVLRLGFEGPYRSQSQGRKIIDEKTDQLYHCILEQRGEPPPLFPENPSFNAHSSPDPSKVFSPWRLVFITGLLLFIFTLGFNYTLGIAERPVYRNLQVLNQSINSSAGSLGSQPTTDSFSPENPLEQGLLSSTSHRFGRKS